MQRHAELVVQDSSQVGAARRQAARMAESSALAPSAIASIALIVTELATNLLRYAQEGRLLFRCSPEDGFEAISIDRGPGLDIQRCLQDGYSTGGSSGTGLGAVRRAATSFDVYSTPNQGTVIWARIAPAHEQESFDARWECAGISLPAPGEVECGDAWATYIDKHDFRVVVTDGLGHGHDAAVVSDRVIDRFRQPTSLGMPSLSSSMFISFCQELAARPSPQVAFRTMEISSVSPGSAISPRPSCRLK